MVMKDKPGTNAFTLMELLVIMAIIAILMGLLVPGVHVLRENGRAADCSNNLRQWGLAMSTYLDDKRGIFPSDGTDGGGGPPSAAKPDAWYNVLPPYLGVKTMKELAQSGDVVTPGYGKSPFICPNSRSASSDSSRSFYSSYAMNYWINAEKDDKSFSSPLRLTQIKNPGVFVIISESPDGKMASVHPSVMMSDDGLTGFRHRGSANALFADGRVAKIPYKTGWRSGMGLSDNAGHFQWNPQNDNVQ
jgi:prepilin-type processing-associated H-X9-DG protein